MSEFNEHIGRLKAATYNRMQRGDLPVWVKKHTYLNGRNFDTKGHEYQDRILAETSPDIVIKKSAQIGISEMSLRGTLGLVSIMPNFSAIYTMPSATDASDYSKARLDPIIRSSPLLRSANKGLVSSAEVKQLGQNNFMYMKGAAVGNAAISVSADLLVHDELSFSDKGVIEQYGSRTIHSPYKWRIRLSTPTFPGDAIDKAFKASRQHYLMARCEHCGHFWLPNYYEDVKIPGFRGSLKEITEKNLYMFRYLEAKVACPKCGKHPCLLPHTREWVVANQRESHVAAGFALSPFDCPTFITPGDLILASTKYNSRAKFEQFHLGIASEDADNGFTRDDIEAIGIEMVDSPFSTHVIGSDMGMVCRLFVAGETTKGEMIVTHTDQINLEDFRTKYKALAKQFRCTSKVLDTQPNVETVMNLQTTDPNLFGALFVNKKGLMLYDTKSKDENKKEGRPGLQEVLINKNSVLDLLLDLVRRKQILIRRDENWEDVVTQLTSMKRIKQMTDDGEIYVWRKPEDGMDHFHMALVYAYLALRIRGAAHAGTGVAPLVKTFKLKDHYKRKGPRTGTGMRTYGG